MTWSFPDLADLDLPDFSDWRSYLSDEPIGAFYESRTPATDTASAIADKTPVLLNANSQGLGASALEALDINHDGSLAGTELASLRAWVDANENGSAEAGEIKTLAEAAITTIHATDYGFLTQGNSRVASAPVAAPQNPADSTMPARVNKIGTVPASNYRTLRDTDDRYVMSSGYYISPGKGGSR